MTNDEIMKAAFLKNFPPEAVFWEAIRLARDDERDKLTPDIIRMEERGRLAAMLDEVKGRLGVIAAIDRLQTRI